jgi:hypothetical protein
MKKILILILLLVGNYLFAQPLTSTPAGCAVTVGTQYRVYQIITTSFNGRPTYVGTGAVSTPHGQMVPRVSIRQGLPALP